MLRPDAVKPAALSVADAARYTSLGLTAIKALLRTGAVPFRKAGRRTVILRADLDIYLGSLPTARPLVPRGEAGRFVEARV